MQRRRSPPRRRKAVPSKEYAFECSPLQSEPPSTTPNRPKSAYGFGSHFTPHSNPWEDSTSPGKTHWSTRLSTSTKFASSTGNATGGLKKTSQKQHSLSRTHVDFERGHSRSFAKSPMETTLRRPMSAPRPRDVNEQRQSDSYGSRRQYESPLFEFAGSPGHSPSAKSKSYGLSEEEQERYRQRERSLREQVKLQQEQLIDLGQEEIINFDSVIRGQLDEKLAELQHQKDEKLQICLDFQQDIKKKIEELQFMLKEADWKADEIEGQFTDSAEALMREYERTLQAKKERVAEVLDRQLKDLEELFTEFR